MNYKDFCHWKNRIFTLKKYLSHVNITTTYSRKFSDFSSDILGSLRKSSVVFGNLRLFFGNLPKGSGIVGKWLKTSWYAKQNNIGLFGAFFVSFWLKFTVTVNFFLLSQWYTVQHMLSNKCCSRCSRNVEQCIMWYWTFKYAVRDVESYWTLLNENRAWLYFVQQVAATSQQVKKSQQCSTFVDQQNLNDVEPCIIRFSVKMPKI